MRKLGVPFGVLNIVRILALGGLNTTGLFFGYWSFTWMFLLVVWVLFGVFAYSWVLAISLRPKPLKVLKMCKLIIHREFTRCHTVSLQLSVSLCDPMRI